MPNGISIGTAVFAQLLRQTIAILYNGPLLPHSELLLRREDLDHMVPWATRVHNPNGISIGSAVFAGLTIVPYTPTDRPTDG